MSLGFKITLLPLLPKIVEGDLVKHRARDANLRSRKGSAS